VTTYCLSSDQADEIDGVLFGYAPELFPTPSRGTGDALVACCQRVFGLFAPIIAVYSPAAKNPDGPVYTSGAIYLLYVPFPIVIDLLLIAQHRRSHAITTDRNER
jgi:hypothetical protein